MTKEIEDRLETFKPFGWRIASAAHRTAFLETLRHTGWKRMTETDMAIRWDYFSRGWLAHEKKVKV